jgi:hypothetical protein
MIFPKRYFAETSVKPIFKNFKFNKHVNKLKLINFNLSQQRCTQKPIKVQQVYFSRLQNSLIMHKGEMWMEALVNETKLCI